MLAFMYQGLTALIMLYIVAFRMIFAGMQDDFCRVSKRAHILESWRACSNTRDVPLPG